MGRGGGWDGREGKGGEDEREGGKGERMWRGPESSLPRGPVLALGGPDDDDDDDDDVFAV